MPSEELTLQTGKDSDLLTTAKKRFKLAADAEDQNRRDSLDDLKFSIGEQWPGDVMSGREGRVSLVMDQLQQAIGQVCNEYRQQRPATQINPVGDDADVDTAEILQGIVRHIEVNCDAEIAYDKAHEQVVRTGFGHWRFLTEYIDDDGAQEIYIVPIRNQFTVYWQPGVEHEKAMWAFIVSDIPNPDYKEDYKDSELANSLTQFTSTGDTQGGWITNEYIRVAEYFTVKETRPKGKAIKREVTWRKINAIEELDKKELPGSSIPILTAVGHDIDVNGKRYLAGLVRNAKDPQRMYNYWNSAATEAIALAPKAPFIMAEGQDEGHPEWKTANRDNWSALYYKPISLNGTTLPPPQRQTAEVPVQALLAMTQQAGINIRAATGLYDPSLGQRKGDESGRAIEKLQKQGDIATLNYSDNLARTMRRSGRLLLEWIRYYYEVPQVQRIIKPDGTVSHVVIHNGESQAQDAKALAESAQIKKIYDIGTGRYDVTVSVGPSYQTKRQEAVATQLEMLKIMGPDMARNFLDFVIRNSDIPQSKEMADRAKKLLPPQLQDGEEGDPEVKLQQAQSTLQQMSQQHELMTKALNDAAEVIKSKKIEQDGKAQIAKMQEDTKLMIVKLQEATKLSVAQISASKDLHQTFAENEINQYDLLHTGAHELAMQKDQQAHEQAMGAQQAAQDQQSQVADQQHEAGQQASDQAHEANMTAVSQDHEQQMAEQAPTE